jgi:regulator of sigma E protease
VLVTLASFIFVLGVLIFVHELGHFLAAKAVGIGVPRFSIGFGPATPLRFTRGETEYVIAWFPLGGYVKMASREEQEAMAELEGGETPDDYPPEKLFENKPLGARIMVILAGVVMNVLFGWVTYAVLAGVYGRTEDPTTTMAAVEARALPAEARHLADVPRGAQIVGINGDTMRSYDAIRRSILSPTSERLRIDFANGVESVIVPIKGTDIDGRVRVDEALRPAWGPVAGLVHPGQPAHAAGIATGDRFIAVNGDTILTFFDLYQVVDANPDVPLTLTMQRDDSLFAVTVTPTDNVRPDPVTGEDESYGRIGVSPDFEPLRIRYGFGGSMVEGWRRTVEAAALIYATVKGIVFREVSTREIGGPIFIGQISGQLARVGLAALFDFMALLSINLAVLNILPIPVLDGGHLVFLLIEGVRGKPLSVAARMRLIQAGMLLLLGLMVLVFTNDILRLVGG